MVSSSSYLAAAALVHSARHLRGTEITTPKNTGRKSRRGLRFLSLVTELRELA